MNKEAYEKYSYQLKFFGSDGVWQIVDTSVKCRENEWQGKVIFEMPFNENDLDPPKQLREEYERLIDWKNGDTTSEPFNIVEFMNEDESAFDQPCKFGHRVDGHAVYCHNVYWLYSPRKCRRTWYTGGEVRDEDCEGFSPNTLLEA